MPPLETKDRTTTVVLWEALELRDNYGEVRVRPAREIMVRWVDDTQEVIDAGGNTIRVDAQMATAEPIPLGSIVFKGTLSEHSNANPALLMQVIIPNEQDDLKGRHTRREYKLMRFKDYLPTIVTGP